MFRRNTIAVLVTPHPGASMPWSRLGPNASAPLVGASACRTYASTAGTRLDARIAEERTGAAP